MGGINWNHKKDSGGINWNHKKDSGGIKFPILDLYPNNIRDLRRTGEYKIITISKQNNNAHTKIEYF